MTILGRLLERRASLENPQQPLTSNALVQWLDGAPSTSGVRVTEKSSLQHIAVYRCVELIAGTCAALPLKAFEKPGRVEVDTPVLYDPHPELTKFEVWEYAYACLLLWGNAYFEKAVDGLGRVRRLRPIHPSRVTVEAAKNPPTDDPDRFYPGSKVFIVDGKRSNPYTRNEILHIPGLGYDGLVGMSRIQLAAQAIGVGLAAEQYAGRFFANGQQLSGILSTDEPIEESDAKRMKSRWKEAASGLDNAHDIVVVDNGAKFQPVSIPARDAQLLESRGWSTTEIARLFGLPPHAIGDVAKSTSWGTGIEQQTIGMVQFTLQPSYLTRVEQRLTKEVLWSGDRRQVYAKHIVEGLMRGDAKTRAAFYMAMRQMKAMNANEVRDKEDLEPYDGGDVFDNPLITVDDGDDNDPAPAPDDEEDGE